MLELNTLISLEEVKQAVTKLSNRKSPGLNDVPLDAFKALDNQNLLTLLDFFNSYWKEETDFEEWHKANFCQSPRAEI